MGYFINPLLTKDVMERGLNAVNNEYKKNLDDDESHFNQLQAHLSTQNSPFNRFGIGNLETLGDINFAEMQQRFIDHSTKYFNANNLRLAVLGKETLDTLQSYVADKFADIHQSP